MEKTKSTVHRIVKGDLLSLLNKNDFQILYDVSRTDFGFAAYLEKKRYAEDEDGDQILEIIVEILKRVCSIHMHQKVLAKVNRFFRMLADCLPCLFDDIPQLINLQVKEKRDISLINLMCNYMSFLRVALEKNVFPCDKILKEIFPALENYMNRLREFRLSDLDKAEEKFKYLRMKVEKFEDPPLSEDDSDDDELNIKNFRLLSIVPRSNDIVNCEIYNIPHNIVDRPYKSVDHYLSVHYRLTREDMLRAFRECVRIYISPFRQRNTEITKVNIYENVSVGYPPNYSEKGIVYDIKFVTKKSIDWSQKGPLIPGTLVFLTPDDKLQTVVCATVHKTPRVQTSKSKECCLKIKLEDDTYTDELFQEMTYKMIEPTAFFECYKHVLSAIKDFTEDTLPLSDIITYLDCDDSIPEYLHNMQYCLHEQCDKEKSEQLLDSAEECTCKKFDPLKDEEWPTSEDLGLDDQQYDAFKIALTKKVAVIQGPPGTGKTFIGVKVVKTLLRNKEVKTPHGTITPIVICCLTNHALDQFLEKMLPFTQKIIRLGSQSKCEALEPHKLDNMIYAVHQYYRELADRSLIATMLPSSFQKPLDLVKKIAPNILKDKIEDDNEELILSGIREVSNDINRYLQLYVLCKEKYLEDSSLNEIIHSKFKKQLREAAGSVQKTLSAAVLEWLVCSRSSDLYNKCQKMFYDIKKRECLRIPDVENIWALPEKKRYEVFYCWRKKCLEILERNLETCIEEYKKIMRTSKFKKIEFTKLELLGKADIIGVTTTGACKYKDLLQAASPSILIVEEAAQVLESHIIASLVRSVQHLILIGDHEQLRPLPADNELSERYNLKISMFERLFSNNAPSATLVTQHRMKPCIAELLVPKPYKEYKSFKNVYEYEEIRGIKSSVFFFDHKNYEDENSSGGSSSNTFEAEIIVAFAKYLTFCNYSMSQITILATYAAQFNLIHQFLLQQKLEDIHVTTVDNFQGEENDIIILSFVRSNPFGIGFLKESNRVCVALSRARKGMFCFGNFQLFAEKNELWNDIIEKVRLSDMIGESLPLKCYRHDVDCMVESSDDIYKFLRTGCSKECNFILPCKHKCMRKCHFEDSNHLLYNCKQPCERMIDETRVCPRLCYERCKRAKKKSVELPCGHLSTRPDVQCQEEVSRRLPCNHLVTIPCYTDVEQYKCKASVSVNLDCGHKKSIWCYQKKNNEKVICIDKQPQIAACGHTVEVPCGETFNEDELVSFCKRACDSLLDCGHTCTRLCRSCFETGIHGFCGEKCEMILMCGHECPGFCGSPCRPCNKRCFLFCGHETQCINDCLRPCVQCKQPCERICIHKKCSNLCFESCTIEPCTESFEESLPCGHTCIGLCGDPCPFLCRICNRDAFKDSDTKQNLYVELECEHVVEVNELNVHIDECLISFEWPCCPHCSGRIENSVRYKEKLKQAKEICISSNDISEETSLVFYLVECMFGIDFVKPAPFIKIHKKINKVLKRDNPRADELMVLKNFVMLLKKLVNIEPKLNDCDDFIQEKFITIMSWIYNHLVPNVAASFQQLRELKMAVMQLCDDVAIQSHVRLQNKTIY